VSLQFTLEDARSAYAAKDPALIQLLIDIAASEDTRSDEPVRDGVPTWDRYQTVLSSYNFRRWSKEEQRAYRVSTIAALESEDAEAPLPERLKSYELLLELWSDRSPFARECLLTLIAEVPLRYGPWKALKRIFKEAEAKEDIEVYGALAARFDSAYARRNHQVSQRTLGYLARRAWRFLRRTGIGLPACYPDYVCAVLSQYRDEPSVMWNHTWVANHIFHHESHRYGAKSFWLGWREVSNITKDRAFAELWRRSPRPLFGLLETARCEKARQFAIDSLKADFRASLRELESSWVARLANTESGAIHEFMVWILENGPKFEQSGFRENGLHEAVLRLFDSPSSTAAVYAADYARTHARDLPVNELVRLANNQFDKVRKLATDLLGGLDPRKEVGIDAWGDLLETKHGYEMAAKALRKNFGARELTPEWFRDRLLSNNGQAVDFSKKNLLEVHTLKKLGAGYFADLLDSLANQEEQESHSMSPGRGEAARFALHQLEKCDPNSLDADFLKRLLINEATQQKTIRWIEEDRLEAKAFPLDFLKAIAYHPQFFADPWLNELRDSNNQWAKMLANFDEARSDAVFSWLQDVRRINPAELGFDWLMELVQRGEERYHNFAVETMIKTLLPADFAETDTTEEQAEPTADAPIDVDLEGASFVFTGKMATMPRSTAQKHVRENNGSVASTVNAKLNYLVIGDEGSPLYGEGRKGSKQTKAEKLIEGGAETKIISETAFLQMMTGQMREVSTDDSLAGCQRLWQMLTEAEKTEAPLAQFAMQYFRRHHPDICLAETDRPVDPGAEIPNEFLTFEQFKPLFFDARPLLRKFAIEIAKWEFTRWAAPIEGIIDLCESPYEEVRAFVAEALLADESPEHRRYRVNPEILTADAVYSFCESRTEAVRTLGMRLIEMHSRLQLPEELFRLTESPDRKVRAFVIRNIWSLYRDRGITEDWEPYVPPPPTVGKAAKKRAEEKAKDYGDGAPKQPENLPASHEDLQAFLRRILFEIPPAKLEKKVGATIEQKLKPLPARKAKLYLIDTMRDVALEDKAFAEHVAPLLTEFMGSRGKSEQAACLVAVTRLRLAGATA